MPEATLSHSAACSMVLERLLAQLVDVGRMVGVVIVNVVVPVVEAAVLAAETWGVAAAEKGEASPSSPALAPAAAFPEDAASASSVPPLGCSGPRSSLAPMLATVFT